MSGADLGRALEPLPDEAQVPVRWVRGLLGECLVADVIVDLTLQQVAEKVGRASSTVRGWCASGELRAYRLNGREWRVPLAALTEFFERQRKATSPKAWRGDAE